MLELDQEDIEDIRECIKNNIDLFNISQTTRKIPIECLREFKKHLYWSEICTYQKLSEDTIREFKDYVDWFAVSLYQKLSEEFIIEFKDKLDWYSLSKSNNYDKLK